MTTTSPKIAARAAVLYTLHMQKQLSYTVTVVTETATTETGEKREGEQGETQGEVTRSQEPGGELKKHFSSLKRQKFRSYDGRDPRDDRNS